MMSMPALAVAFAGMTALIAIIIYQDLRNLRIPNWSVVAVFGLFLATGSWGLPFDVFLWRLLYAVIVLALGIALYSIAMGAVGAGDLKLIAALTPFLFPGDLGLVAMIYVATTIVGLIGHRIARSIVGERETGWKALDQKTYFPLGLILGATIVIYLGFRLYNQAG